MTREIFCCACGEDVFAELITGLQAYPHRPDLATLPFWRCRGCGNFVGCHHKTENPTRPLGVIPTPEIKAARQRIHRALDPLWQTGKYSRKQVYSMLTNSLGWRYHTAKIRSVEEANQVHALVLDMYRESP